MTTIKINTTGDNSPVRVASHKPNQPSKKFTLEMSEEEKTSEIIRLRAAKRKLQRKKAWPYMFSSFMILLAAVVVVVNDNRTVSDKEIFNQYYDAFTSDRKSVSDEGVLAYFEGDYKRAANLLKGDSASSILITVDNLIHEKHFYEAIDILKGSNTKQSEWLYTLCLIRVGEHEDALHLLEKIRVENDLFSSKANRVIKEYYYGKRTRKRL